VFIQWAHFADFRNFRRLAYSPSPTLNVLSGPNAQGKTNLLEGLGVLLVGRSFRGARAAELPHWDAGAALLTGEVCRQGGARPVRRSVARREDGTWSLTGEGCAWARAIPFSWADVAIVVGGPQARRNFLDALAGKLAPAHLTALGRYRRVLARRNAIVASGQVRQEVLDPWDDQAVEIGIELMAGRRRAVEAIDREASPVFEALGGHGQVRLAYQASVPEATPEAFRAALQARRRDEMRRGQTLVGPHRDDLRVEVDGRDLRATGSRGQQRLLALALRLAEAPAVAAAVGSEPVLLLDDALSELDPGVQGRVLQHLDGMGQVFLTTAERTLPPSSAHWWEVRAGRVEELTPAPLPGVA
jgi:DNA replication and repair protein RecF